MTHNEELLELQALLKADKNNNNIVCKIRKLMMEVSINIMKKLGRNKRIAFTDTDYKANDAATHLLLRLITTDFEMRNPVACIFNATLNECFSSKSRRQLNIAIHSVSLEAMNEYDL